MTPAKLPAGFEPSDPAPPAVTVSVWLPSTTEPRPASVVIEAPVLVPEMSNVPPVATNTSLEVAMLPLPINARLAVPPTGLGAIAVTPV
jgi:hypothetical protein